MNEIETVGNISEEDRQSTFEESDQNRAAMLAPVEGGPGDEVGGAEPGEQIAGNRPGWPIANLKSDPQQRSHRKEGMVVDGAG